MLLPNAGAKLKAIRALSKTGETVRTSRPSKRCFCPAFVDGCADSNEWWRGSDIRLALKDLRKRSRICDRRRKAKKQRAHQVEKTGC